MRKGVFLIPLLLLASFVTVLPSIREVHATGPTISATNASNNCWVNGALSFTCTISATAGDNILVFFGCLKGGANSCTTLSISDGTNSYTSIGSVAVNCLNGADNCKEQAFCASIASTTTLTLTFTSGVSAILGGDIYEIHGGTCTGLHFQTASNPTGTGCGVLSSPNPSSGDLMAMGCVVDNSSGAWGTSGTPSFTVITNQPAAGSNGGWQGSSYLTNSNGAWTNSAMNPVANGGGAIIVVDMPTGATITVTVVAPCTFFQLQCWWYPMFFFSVYLVLIVTMARMGEVPQKDYRWLAMDGLTMASLIAVIMGMLNPMFPLIFAVTGIMMALRT